MPQLEGMSWCRRHSTEQSHPPSVFIQFAYSLCAAYCGQTKIQQFQSFMFALLAAYYEM